MDVQQLLIWGYVALMGAGALAFWMMSRRPAGVPGLEYMVALLIPVWSGAAYMAMGAGQATVEVAGRTVYYARYIDWAVTTPLLLLALALTAMYRGPKSKTLIAGLMASDVIMILSGLVADLSEGPMRFVWFTFGCVTFAIILYMIWWPLYDIAKSRGPRHAQSFRNLALFLSVLWFIYPISWYIGPSGIGLVGSTTDWFLFTVTPFFSKVVFSLYDLSILRRLSQEAPLEEKRPATEPHTTV
jgi:bacteriorhodopsin